MAGFTYATLTNAGDQAINEAIANNWPLGVVKSTCGSGFPASGDVPPQFTALKAYVMDMQTTSVNASVLYQTTVRVRVNTSAAPSVFVLNEIGVWASLNNGTPFLFAYMTTGNATGGDTIDPGTTIIRDYVVPIVYSQSYPANPVIEITPQVDLHASTHLSSGVDPIPIASSTIGGLTPKTNTRGAQVLTGPATATWGPVPISSATDAGGLPPCPADPTQVGIGSNPATWAPVPIVTHMNPGGLPITPLKPNYRPLTASDGSVSWQPTTPTLNVSTTLWVKAGYPDVAPNFSTLQNAFAYISQYVFSPGISVLINVFPGSYLNPGPIYLDHVNASQITIQGVNGSGALDSDGSFANTGAISGSAGNWNVQLTGCNNIASVTVGGYVLIWSCGGVASSGNALLCGFFYVAAISGSTITINVPWRRSTWPSISGVPGNFTPINVFFRPTNANQYGMIIGQHGMGALRNFGVLQGGANQNNFGYQGLQTNGPTNFNRIGVSNFANNQSTNAGIAVSNGYCNVTACAMTNNSTGLIVSGNGLAACTSCAFTHNYCMGIWCQGGSVLSEHGWCWVAGNSYVVQQAAILIAAKSQIICQGDVNGGNYSAGMWYNVYNAYQGLSIVAQSQLIISSAQDQVYSQYNAQNGAPGTNYDLIVSGLSYAMQASISGSRLFNATVGVLTADGCIIT